MKNLLKNEFVLCIVGFLVVGLIGGWLCTVVPKNWQIMKQPEATEVISQPTYEQLVEENCQLREELETLKDDFDSLSDYQRGSGK